MRPSPRFRSFISLIGVLSLILVPAPGAYASHDANPQVVGGFEIDGNFDFDGIPDATRDWDNVGESASDPPVRIDDLSDSQLDDAFGGGAKEENPDTWTYKDHKSPGKADLTRAYLAADISGTSAADSQAFLWLAFERLAVRGVGDAHVNFELNQKTTTVTNSQGTEVPERSNGDLLALYDYPGGSNPVSLELRVWQGIEDDPSTPENEEALFGTWESLPAAAGGDINEQPVARPEAAPFGGGTVDTRRFGEAGLDIAEALRGAVSCPGFASFNAKSRAAGKSFDAQLKDKTPAAEIDVSTCGQITVEKQDDEGNALDGATFALYSDANGNGTFDRVTDPQVGECTTGEEGIPGECTFNNDGTRPDISPKDFDPGIYFVEETAAPEGFVRDDTIVTVDLGFREHERVSYVFVNPKILYRLSLVPPEDTNLVDNDHVFTATLEKCLEATSTCDSSESVWVAADGEDVNFVLDGTGSISSITPNGSVAADGGSGGCTTGSSGTCDVTVRSPDTGDTTLTATFDKSFSTHSFHLEATGDKDWVNYEIGVVPDDTNLVEEPHTFTVTLRKDEGGGFQAEPGATVDLSWSGPADSLITDVESGTVDPGGQGGQCTTDAAGTCEVTVNSPTSGPGSLTATYNAVVGDTSGSFSASATKLWVDFRISVVPDDINDVGAPHDFTVTLENDEGDGFAPLGGETVDLALDAGDHTNAVITDIAPSGDIGADGRSGTCTTDAAGQCVVTANSTQAGETVLTATFTRDVGANSTAHVEDSAEKIWLDAEVEKLSCPTGKATPGQQIDYDLRATNLGPEPGTALTNARLVDDLPDEVVFLSASAGGVYDASSHTVTWDLGTLAPGESRTLTVTGRVLVDVPSGTTATNVATLTADVIAPRTHSTSVLVTVEGASASGRAYGIRADLLGGELLEPDPDVGPTPDTDVQNPDRLIQVDESVGDASVGADLLSVVESHSVDNTGAEDTAMATTAGISISVPGVELSTSSVVARSSSSATAFDAGSTRDGSKVQDLVVNGTIYGDVSEPITITVTDPLLGVMAEVFVLETTPSGAAAGETQPVDGFFVSGQEVNAIHVAVHDNPATPVNEATDVIVAHAESRATFPSGLACGESIPWVAGDAYLLDTPKLEPPAGATQLGLVTLGSTGGDETSAVADTSPLGAVTGQTHTDGTLDPLEAHSSAVYENVDLQGEAIKATTIESGSDTVGATSTGFTTIADLVIAGTDVCSALGRSSTCQPAPNTVLVLDEGNVIVLLNEQISDGGLRVNAVHIFVVGEGNPFGLPVGAEIVLSSSFTDTSG